MSLKKQTLWSMAPLLVITVINIISVPLFYRFLGPEMYALWFYVLSLSGSFGFADLGIGVAVGRYVGVELGRGDLEAARGYWATGNAVAIPLLVLMAAAFIAIGTIFGPRWFNVTPEQIPVLQWSFVAAGIGAFFAFYGQFWNILAQVNLDFKFVGLLRVVLGVLQVGGSVALAWWTRNAFVLVAWATLLSVVQLIILMLHARDRYGFGIHWSLARLARARDMIGYTTKTFFTLLVNSVLGGLDRLALGKLALPVDFAHYTICSNVGIRISGLSVSIMGPVFGQSSRAVGAGGKVKTAAIYEESFDLIFGWLVLISVWLIVWKHPLLQLWLGKTLGAATEPLLPPIIVAYCLTSVSNVSGAQLGPLNRVGAGLIIHIFARCPGRTLRLSGMAVGRNCRRRLRIPREPNCTCRSGPVCYSADRSEGLAGHLALAASDSFRSPSVWLSGSWSKQRIFLFRANLPRSPAWRRCCRLAYS